MDHKPKIFLPIIVLALVLTTLFSNVAFMRAGVLDIVTTELDPEHETSEDSFGRSNITVSAYENVTFVPLNNSIDLGLSSKIEPTDLTIDIVEGFEPVERFNHDYDNISIRDLNTMNKSLGQSGDGLRLSFNPKDRSQIAISVYELSFVNDVNISGSHFLSLAITTGNNYSSNEGYVGVALLLRDQRDIRHYVFIHISDLHLTEGYVSSQYFLGSSYGKPYPLYKSMYGSSFGPWFMQLPLSDAFSSLNLTSARLEGLFIGVELFSVPLPYTIMQADVRFRYALVHRQPFSINKRVVNSTEVTFPTIRFLNISGIPCKMLNAIVTGPLQPSYEREEERENKSVKVVEVIYNFSEAFYYNFSEASVHEAHVEGRVNITVWSKTVKKCTLTFNNVTVVDLTNFLLESSQGLVHGFPHDTRLLQVLLTLYKFNAWIFDRTYALLDMTKRGIIEEYFIPDKNEGVIIVDLNEAQLQEANIAIRVANFSLSQVSINGVKKPLHSLLMLNGDMFFTTSIQAEENTSLYNLTCTFSSDPLYSSSTLSPFTVFIENTFFEIYTPFNIEAQLGTQVPVTVNVFTSKTYILKVEYDSRLFELDNDQLMVHKRISYEYFMLKPIHIGRAVTTVHFIDPTAENPTVSIPFLINITHSPAYQIIFYMLAAIAVLSLMYIVGGRNFVDLLLRRHKRKNG